MGVDRYLKQLETISLPKEYPFLFCMEGWCPWCLYRTSNDIDHFQLRMWHHQFSCFGCVVLRIPGQIPLGNCMTRWLILRNTATSGKDWNYFRFPEGVNTRFITDSDGNAELLLLVSCVINVQVSDCDLLTSSAGQIFSALRAQYDNRWTSCLQHQWSTFAPPYEAWVLENIRP